MQWSRLFNERLQAIAQRAGVLGKGEVRSFFQLFKELDIDGSRRISFFELERMVREKLKLPLKEMPMEKLYGLWRRLDENESGYIDAGELSRFMRIGAPKSLTPAQLPRTASSSSASARTPPRPTPPAPREGRGGQGGGGTQGEPRGDSAVWRLFSRQLRHAATRSHGSLSYYSLFADGLRRLGPRPLDEFERMCAPRSSATRRACRRPAVGLWARSTRTRTAYMRGEFQRFMRTAAEAPRRRARRSPPSRARGARDGRPAPRGAVGAFDGKELMEVAAAMEAEARPEASLGAVATAPVRRPSAQLEVAGAAGAAAARVARRPTSRRAARRARRCPRRSNWRRRRASRPPSARNSSRSSAARSKRAAATAG